MTISKVKPGCRGTPPAVAGKRHELEAAIDRWPGADPGWIEAVQFLALAMFRRRVRAEVEVMAEGKAGAFDWISGKMWLRARGMTAPPPNPDGWGMAPGVPVPVDLRLSRLRDLCEAEAALVTAECGVLTQAGYPASIEAGTEDDVAEWWCDEARPGQPLTNTRTLADLHPDDRVPGVYLETNFAQGVVTPAKYKEAINRRLDDYADRGFLEPVNQRASFRWVAGPDPERIIPATGQVGIVADSADAAEHQQVPLPAPSFNGLALPPCPIPGVRLSGYGGGGESLRGGMYTSEDWPEGLTGFGYAAARHKPVLVTCPADAERLFNHGTEMAKWFYSYFVSGGLPAIVTTVDARGNGLVLTTYGSLEVRSLTRFRTSKDGNYEEP